MVDIDPNALRAKNLSATDVTNAILAQNLILPSGTAKVGMFEYNVKLNASPKALEELNDLPVKTVDGATIYLRDVGHVRDGYSPQQNIVRVDGRKSVLTTIQKNGAVSTLDIISRIKALMPRIRAGAPPGLEVELLGDQSTFVKSAVTGVALEAVIAACLTALMILLFLGSWRSTLIITVSIPLAILSSLTVLSALGETINVMTLGGLALAVGILVDDATVTIENINWHLEQGKDVRSAILDGGAQIIIPALFSLLSICIVFVPMFFLEGVARFLFVPMAEAVIFALVASFILSRTLVPTLAMYLLHPHSLAHPHASGHLGFVMDAGEISGRPRSLVGRLAMFQRRFEDRLPRFGRPTSTPCGSRSSTARCSWSARPPPSRSRSCWCRCWARISFRRSMPARSSCTFAARPACGSRRRRGCAMPSRARSARRYRRANSRRSSTTSACRPAAPTWRTATRARSARPTPTS